MTDNGRRTAVIGAGIAGLTAAYLLSARDHTTLFEADDRLGGHAHTHQVTDAAGGTHGVDSGFIVHNERTYPLLRRLFHELDVATSPTEMSMSIRCEGCGLEYAGARGARGVLARPRNVADPRFLRLLAEVPRFHRRARRLLAAGAASPLTVGAFLSQGRFSHYFTQHFAVPLVSAVWSCAPGQALRYPAVHLFRFLDHHGMLSVGGSPRWRVVDGGSANYVTPLAKRLTAVRTGTPVRTVLRHTDGARVITEDGTTHVVDHVVVATHADQALALLGDATERERRVLGAFRSSRNVTVLHTDSSLLPDRPAARASWNYLIPECAAPSGRVLVSYDMNRLQRLTATERYVVTLNPGQRVEPTSVLAHMTYEHPLFTPESVAAQAHLPELNDGVTAFAGAYHGWGFHEDGCRSGVAAARSLGVRW
ncbi:FAD-dependent oxidoreductase [Streptomyces sp. DSM 44915]|uniref:FAD-dependent oxidoreductase n=1 Tax=Streptomyces chisholmiae TaxID=3075540 RepID=A0ABU2JR75_9ACTN|nr:FAD-dependent oxidoreductase [Streptomyces sp. DSM 44915]MDT0267481.1 FAD-dependent oxidoreductase [Streptomyces sp. DSM 44915]